MTRAELKALINALPRAHATGETVVCEFCAGSGVEVDDNGIHSGCEHCEGSGQKDAETACKDTIYSRARSIEMRVANYHENAKRLEALRAAIKHDQRELARLIRCRTCDGTNYVGPHLPHCPACKPIIGETI